MEIDQLKAFIALAQTKSFSKTAEQLHLVQSTVSTRIRLLEESVGKPLFLRDNRTVQLTQAGQALLAYAERILKLSDEGVRKIRGAHIFDESMTVGSTDSLWTHLFMPVLVDFTKRFPKIALVVRTAHSWEVVQDLMDGSIHFALVFIKPNAPGFTTLTLLEDEVILVAHASHPLAKARRVGRAEIFDSGSFITCVWDGPLQQWLESVMPRDYIPPVLPDQLRILVKLVLAGRGVTYLPRLVVKNELAKGTLVQVSLGPEIRPPKRKVYAVFRPDKRRRALIDKWLGLLKEHGFKIS